MGWHGGPLAFTSRRRLQVSALDFFFPLRFLACVPLEPGRGGAGREHPAVGEAAIIGNGSCEMSRAVLAGSHA